MYVAADAAAAFTRRLLPLLPQYGTVFAAFTPRYAAAFTLMPPYFYAMILRFRAFHAA